MSLHVMILIFITISTLLVCIGALLGAHYAKFDGYCEGKQDGWKDGYNAAVEEVQEHAERIVSDAEAREANIICRGPN